MTERDTERTRRIGLNEAVFREVNERVDALNRDFGVDDERIEILCECGDPECVERIEIDPAQYRELRADGRRFAVLRGHEAPDVETVVAEREGYDVVQKHPGEAARLAESTDPRS